MPERCVAALCDNVNDPENNISLHRIPFFGETCPVKQRRRNRWVNFVLERRKNWVPGKTSSLCSVHFTEDDFTRPPNLGVVKMKRELKRDEIGVCVYPSRHISRDNCDEEVPSKKSREQRMIVRSAKARLRNLTTQEIEGATASHTATSGPSTSSDAIQYSTENARTEVGGNEASAAEVLGEEDMPIDHVGHDIIAVEHAAQEESVIASLIDVDDYSLQPAIANKCKASTQDESSQTLADQTYNLLTREVDKLKRQLESSQEALGKCQGKNKQLKRKVNALTNKVQQLESQLKMAQNIRSNQMESSANADLEDAPTTGDQEYHEDDEDDDDDDETIEEEPDLFSSGGDDLFSESDEQTDTEDNFTQQKGKSIPLSNHHNLRTEPKHIVFLSKLLLLFQFCHICRSEIKPTVTATQNGTEVVIKTTCNNPGCGKDDTWNSQPLLPGTRTAAGNFLLCMATLFAGGSFTKVKQIFQHMGLSCVSLNTFFTHQRNKLFPTIHLFWKEYQANLLSQLKDLGAITIAGDGRHDSMGHCAKYCAYTVFCCTLPRIIHFALVQRNQAGSSPAMEFLGFQTCINFLIGCGVVIGTLISDRHVQIASHMRNVLKNITHYFDLWHLKKKIRKVLSKIAKEKGNEEIQQWVKPCEKHLYWSATTTSNGDGRVIWAKFKSFLSHIVNKHSGLDDPKFNKCAHGEIPDRKWLDPDHAGYEKMKKALTAESLKKGIMQASPLAQTDCLEGFHSVLNLFAPKLIAYSYIGMYCRHILAALHFNYNLHRDDKVNEDDSVPLKVSYPKFKNGEATVRSRKVEQKFDYVEELFQFFLGLGKEQLQGAVQDLKVMTPEPMNSMLVDKQPREEAVKKRAERLSMVTRDVPPTTDPEEGHSAEPVPTQPEGQRREQSTRARPLCSACKNPMRGHRFIENCPKNRKE